MANFITEQHGFLTVTRLEEADASFDPKYAPRIERLLNSLEKELSQARSSLDKLKQNPGKYAPQAENLLNAFRQFASTGRVGMRTLGADVNEGVMEAKPTEDEIMDAEEEVGNLLGAVDDKSKSPAEKKELLKKAWAIMKKVGLDKERDWMQQYRMRAKG